MKGHSASAVRSSLPPPCRFRAGTLKRSCGWFSERWRASKNRESIIHTNEAFGKRNTSVMPVKAGIPMAPERNGFRTSPERRNSTCPLFPTPSKAGISWSLWMFASEAVDKRPSAEPVPAKAGAGMTEHYAEYPRKDGGVLVPSPVNVRPMYASLHRISRAMHRTLSLAPRTERDFRREGCQEADVLPHRRSGKFLSSPPVLSLFSKRGYTGRIWRPCFWPWPWGWMPSPWP